MRRPAGTGGVLSKRKAAANSWLKYFLVALKFALRVGQIRRLPERRVIVYQPAEES